MGGAVFPPGTGQPTLHELLDQGFSERMNEFEVDLDDVANCSFTDFWRKYRTDGDGARQNKFKARPPTAPMCSLVFPPTES